MLFLSVPRSIISHEIIHSKYDRCREEVSRRACFVTENNYSSESFNERAICQYDLDKIGTLLKHPFQKVYRSCRSQSDSGFNSAAFKYFVVL
jgi:hypothetical protein